jgi:hypothetical protein
LNVDDHMAQNILALSWMLSASRVDEEGSQQPEGEASHLRQNVSEFANSMDAKIRTGASGSEIAESCYHPFLELERSLPFKEAWTFDDSPEGQLGAAILRETAYARGARAFEEGPLELALKRSRFFTREMWQEIAGRVKVVAESLEGNPDDVHSSSP